MIGQPTDWFDGSKRVCRVATAAGQMQGVLATVCFHTVSAVLVPVQVYPRSLQPCHWHTM